MAEVLGLMKSHCDIRHFSVIPDYRVSVQETEAATPATDGLEGITPAIFVAVLSANNLPHN